MDLCLLMQRQSSALPKQQQQQQQVEAFCLKEEQGESLDGAV